MKTLQLTAEIAFAAARELSREGLEVNSNQLWLRCGGVGSRGTAQKWATAWNAFESGQEVETKLERYRDLYEAIKQGEMREGESLASSDEAAIPQVEGAVDGLADTLSAIVRQLVEERTQEFRESCGDVARQEQERATLATEELRGVRKEWDALRTAHQELLERYELLARTKEVLQGQHDSLERQCAEKGEHIERLEGKVSELAQKCGKQEARASELENALKMSETRCGELESQRVILGDECATLRNREGQLAQKCAALEVELKGAVSRYDDERNQRERLEEEIRSLNTQLLEREGRACTAQEKVRQTEERARQLEAQVAALQEEVREMRSPMAGEEETKKTSRKRSGGSK